MLALGRVVDHDERSRQFRTQLPYSLWWGGPAKYVRRAWWRHFIWSRI